MWFIFTCQPEFNVPYIWQIIAIASTNISVFKGNECYSGLSVLHYFNIIKTNWWQRINGEVQSDEVRLSHILTLHSVFASKHSRSQTVTLARHYKGFWYGHRRESNRLEDKSVDGKIILGGVRRYELDWERTAGGCQCGSYPSVYIKCLEVLECLRTCWLLQKQSVAWHCINMT